VSFVSRDGALDVRHIVLDSPLDSPLDSLGLLGIGPNIGKSSSHMRG
jgi:hypothetical protein